MCVCVCVCMYKYIIYILDYLYLGSWILIKIFLTVCPRQIYQSFSSDLSALKCSFVIKIRQVWKQNKDLYSFLTQCS